MSDNPILATLVAEMLKELQAVFAKFNIDFYLVGIVSQNQYSFIIGDSSI